MALGKCQCCDKEPAVGVASMPGIPISIAWGRQCLEARVVPYGLLVANSACAGPDADGRYAEWWEETIERTLAYFGRARDEFEREVADSIAEMAQAMGGEADDEC